MAVVSIVEAQEHADLVASRGGKREWQCPYKLTVDNPRDDGQTIVDYFDTIGRGLSMGLVYGDREDMTVICKSIHPTRQMNSVLHWIAVLTYSPLDPTEKDDGGEDPDGNPTDDPLDYRYDISSGIQYYQVPVYHAWNMDAMPKDGTAPGYVRALESLGPVHNSAGVVYDPPLMREIPESVLRVTGNVSHYDPRYSYLAGAINQYTLHWNQELGKYGFLEEAMQGCCVLCAGVSADYRRESGVDFWRYTFEWRIRERATALNPQDGFLESILDRGITRIANGGAPDGAGGTISPSDIEVGMAEATAIRDWQGERVPELVLLDGHGRPLQGSNTYSAPPVYFRWRIHPYGVFTYPSIPLKIFR